MAILNLGKFAECLGLYKHYCDRTIWTKNEISKFYFANLLTRRIKLNVQSARTVFEICDRVQHRDFYHKPTDSKICGIQFLPAVGKAHFSEPLTPSDVALIKELTYRNWNEDVFATKRIGFNALSGWLGTLLPHKFMPATSTHFRHTISYLFDLELRIYQETDYEYFLHSQKYFLLTKKRLKEFNLSSLYLKEIAEFIRFTYPKSMMKKEYEEHDWNWLTFDFHQFVYRVVLGLDNDSDLSVVRLPSEKDKQKRAEWGFQSAKILNLYMP